MPTINGRACVVNGKPVDKVYSDGRQVYGRNLLKNSDFSKGSDGFQGWISDRTKYVTVAVDGTAQITTADGSGRIYKNAVASPFLDLADGERFVISFDAYSSVPGTVMSVGQGLYINQKESCVQVSLTTTPTRYVATLIKRGTLTFSIYLIGTGGQIGNIGKIKVERGKQATDWTPAPEDVM